MKEVDVLPWCGMITAAARPGSISANRPRLAGILFTSSQRPTSFKDGLEKNISAEPRKWQYPAGDQMTTSAWQ
jgi:hypothetical protein